MFLQALYPYIILEYRIPKYLITAPEAKDAHLILRPASLSTQFLCHTVKGTHQILTTLADDGVSRP